ncbi:MAG: patatin-like phospholipase family protein [Gammaproteobacteria bacterium]|nr:patatin-like phospholipase family protein [Gammaproteobacteria bacterium]MCF6362587.1 patatin-like phospholipase family protein [Gammaproteobacteria bacterium]
MKDSGSDVSDSSVARKTVSLVLGSGGARGMAHVGVIEYLLDQDYDIRCISGASIGALVGGIYATGRLDLFRDWLLALSKTDVLRYLDFSFSGTALFRGEKIIDALRELVGEHLIEDLPVSYTAVATDVERQKEVWLSDGPLFDAIRASIAVPTIFTPYHYRGMRLLDGGLLNPVPIAPTLKEVTDLTIAVNLNAVSVNHLSRQPPHQPPRKVADRKGVTMPPTGIVEAYHQRINGFLDDLQQNFSDLAFRSSGAGDLGLFDLLNNSFETMQNAITNIKLATYSPDVLIEIPRETCKAHEFYRARELVEVGYERASEAISS